MDWWISDDEMNNGMLMAGSGWDNSSQLSSFNCHTLKVFTLKVEKWDKNQNTMPYYPKVLTVVL